MKDRQTWDGKTDKNDTSKMGRSIYHSRSTYRLTDEEYHLWPRPARKSSPSELCRHLLHELQGGSRTNKHVGRVALEENIPGAYVCECEFIWYCA